MESEKAILNENLRKLRTLFDNEKSKTCSLTSKVEDLEADISKLKKSATGLKSGIARARVCKNLEPSTATNQSVSTSRRFEDNELGFVAITGVFEGTSKIFKGSRFSKCIFIAANKAGIFSNLSCEKLNSAACEKTLSERATHLFHILRVLSGLAPGQALNAVGQSDKELGLLISKFFCKYIEYFKAILPMRSLSPKQALNVKSVLRMSGNQFTRLRTMFYNMDYRIFPSESAVRQEEANLVGYIQSIFDDLKLKGMIDSDHESVISLLFSGDKGGEHRNSTLK